MRKPKGKNHLEYLDVDGRIILNEVFEKWYEMAWIELLRLGTYIADGLL